MTFTPGLVAYTPIKVDRVAEFEAWARSVLMTDLDGPPGEWQLMRTDEQRDGAVVFLFLFEGDDLEAWDMEAALQGKYGADRAHAEVEKVSGMIDGDQLVWRLTPVS
jgi:hypothetical protein